MLWPMEQRRIVIEQENERIYESSKQPAECDTFGKHEYSRSHDFHNVLGKLLAEAEADHKCRFWQAAYQFFTNEAEFESNRTCSANETDGTRRVHRRSCNL